MEGLEILHCIVPLRLALSRSFDVVQALQQDIEPRHGVLVQLPLSGLEVLDVPHGALDTSKHGGHALKLREGLVLEGALALLENLLFERGHGAELVLKLGLGDAEKVFEAVLDAGQGACCQVALDGKGEVEDGSVGANDVLEELLDQRAGLPLGLVALVVQAVVVAYDDHDLADVAQTRAEEGVEVVVAVDGGQGELDGVPGHADALGGVLGDEVAGGHKVFDVGHDVGDPRLGDLDIAQLAAAVLLAGIALQDLGRLLGLFGTGSLAQELGEQLCVLRARVALGGILAEADQGLVVETALVLAVHGVWRSDSRVCDLNCRLLRQQLSGFNWDHGLHAARQWGGHRRVHNVSTAQSPGGSL